MTQNIDIRINIRIGDDRLTIPIAHDKQVTGSHVLDVAKRYAHSYAATDWNVTANGREVFSKTIEDRRADDYFNMVS